MYQKSSLQAYKEEYYGGKISRDIRLTIPVIGVMVRVKLKSEEAGIAVGEQSTAEQGEPELAHWALAGPVSARGPVHPVQAAKCSDQQRCSKEQKHKEGGTSKMAV